MSHVGGDKYLIEIEKGGRLQRLVWNSARPLPIAFPVKWLAEKTASGIRFRNLAPNSTGRVYANGLLEVPEPGANPVSIEGPEFKLRVSRVRAERPAYLSATAAGGELTVYACLRESIVATLKPAADGSVGTGKESLFRITPSEGGYRVEARTSGLEVRLNEKGTNVARKPLEVSRAFDVPTNRIQDLEISTGAQSWRFGFVQKVDVTFTTRTATLDTESVWFKKQLQRTGIGMAVLALTLILWPQADKVVTPDEAIIPEQFAKIVMKPTSVKPETQPKAQGGGGARDAGGVAAGPKVEGKDPVQATKASNTAVARAFRTKALQNSVKGLLKGGMTTFLAQGGTQLLGADSSNQVQKIFDGTSEVGALPSSPDAGYARGPDVKVGVGGGGFGGKGGTERGVGYGTGKKAGIGGQGGAFVSLDLPGSSVEDGLSKDEVGKVIHSHLAEVRYCYEASMLRNPDIAGKLVLDFSIGPTGSVTSASVKESSLQDPRLDDCILRRLTKWAFPQPKGGVTVAVSYPFIFKALTR